MKKVVIIGANSFQNRLILKAKDMGYETHVFAWECGDVGEETADYFYPISITEKVAILEKCKEIKPDAVCSIGSDLAVLTVNYVARELGLNANSNECDWVSTNKYAMREAFEKSGVYAPKHRKVHQDEIDDFSVPNDFEFPIIVKPTDRSGSRSITKLDTEEGLVEALRAACKDSFEDCAILEEYLDGKEFSCECISFNGKHTMLAITEKFTTEAPHFIETGHIEPAPLSKEQCDAVKDTVFRALDALGIKNSASHSEFKLDDSGRVKIIEIGARMGGDCIGSDLVYLSTGNDYMRMVIDVASGKEPDINKENANRVAAIRFLMTSEDVKRVDELMAGLDVVYVSEIEKDTQNSVIDSSSRYGYFIVVGDDYNLIKDKLFRE